MRCTWGSRAALAAPVALALAGAAPLRAQVRSELGIEAMALAAHPGFGGAGLWLAIRPSARLRLGALAALGDRDGTALRGEITAHFLLDPFRRRGPGLYAGGGLAGETGRRGATWVVALLGVEGAPGGRTGWVVEVGVGGGVRISAGWRWRFGGAGG